MAPFVTRGVPPVLATSVNDRPCLCISLSLSLTSFFLLCALCASVCSVVAFALTTTWRANGSGAAQSLPRRGSVDSHLLEGSLESPVPRVVLARPLHSRVANLLSFRVIPQVKPRLLRQVFLVFKEHDLFAGLKELREFVEALDQVKRPAHRRFEVAEPHLLDRLGPVLGDVRHRAEPQAHPAAAVHHDQLVVAQRRPRPS